MSINRNGIALLITMGFIAMITAAVLSTTDTVVSHTKQTQEIRNMVQAQIVIANIKGVLDELTSSVKSSEDIELFESSVPPTIASEDSSFILDLAIKSAHGKININNLIDTNATANDMPIEISDHYKEFLYTLLTNPKHDIESPDYMIALISDTLDSDDNELSSQTERKLYDPNFKDGGIYSRQTLDALSQAYAKHIKDGAIFNVDWDEYFWYGPKENTILDCVQLDYFYDRYDVKSFAIAKYLETQKGVIFSGENLYTCTPDSNVSATLNGYNIKSYDGESPYYLHIDVSYTLNKQIGRFTALYDIKTKGLRNVVVH